MSRISLLIKLYLNKKKIKEKIFRIQIPTHIRRNYIRTLPLVQKNHIDVSFSFNKVNASKDERLDYFRKILIPWIDSFRKINGLRILEIGCGTGSSTIAFSEQSAIITAIDINEDYLQEAKARIQLLGLKPLLLKLNAFEIENYFTYDSFDLIIFVASFEHMTLPEREKSLAAAYNLLAKRGLLCITGSPNRLHFMDSHTSILPFFNWLPDELAIKYSKYSHRAHYYNHLMGIEDKNEKIEQFYRWGRGISFHEIEIALRPINELKIVSDLTSFLRKKNFLYALATAFTSNFKYEKFLSKKFPVINKAFFRPYIDILIEKK